MLSIDERGRGMSIPLIPWEPTFPSFLRVISHIFGVLKPAFFMLVVSHLGLYMAYWSPENYGTHAPQKWCEIPTRDLLWKRGLLSGAMWVFLFFSVRTVLGAYMCDHDLGGITHQWGRQKSPHQHHLVTWLNQPIWKIWSSKWESSPGRLGK